MSKTLDLPTLKIKASQNKRRRESTSHRLRHKDKRWSNNNKKIRHTWKRTLLALSKQRKSNNGPLKLQEQITQASQKLKSINSGNVGAWEIPLLKWRLIGKFCVISPNNTSTNCLTSNLAYRLKLLQLVKFMLLIVPGIKPELVKLLRNFLNTMGQSPMKNSSAILLFKDLLKKDKPKYSLQIFRLPQLWHLVKHNTLGI